MLPLMKSREQQVADVHNLLRELGGEEEGAELAEAVLAAIKAFDFPSARDAAERFDLDEVRRAAAEFNQTAESQGDLGGYVIYDLGPLQKALAGFDEIAEIIGNPELALRAVRAYSAVAIEVEALATEQFGYEWSAGAVLEWRKPNPWYVDPYEWKDLVAKVMSQDAAPEEVGPERE